MSSLDNLRRYFQELGEYATGSTESGSTSSSFVDTKALSQDIINLVSSDIQDKDLDYTSSLLFDSDRGILRFLLSNLNKPEHISAKCNFLEFLARYIERVGASIQPYAIDIKNACVTLFTSDASAKVKQATFDPIIALLDTCARDLDGDQLDAKNLFDKYFKDYATMQSKLAASVKSSMLQLLGTITRHYPQHASSRAIQLLRFFVTTMEYQLFKAKTADSSLLVGALRGLDSFLFSERELLEKNAKDSQTVYACIKVVIDLPEDLTRYEVPKAGLQLMVDHINLFRPYLFEGAIPIYTNLRALSEHKNNELSNIARRALLRFLKEMGSLLASQSGTPKERDCFWFFMTQFSNALKADKIEVRDLSMAIHGYGYFAAPCKKYMDEGQLQTLLSHLLKKSAWFYSDTNDDLESMLRHIGSFIQAYTCIAREYDVIPESLMSTLEQITGTMLVQYPRMAARFRLAAVLAFQELLWMLFEKGVGFLKRFLKLAVYQTLVLTCSDALKTTGAGRSESRAADELDEFEDHAYMDFFYFWENIFQTPQSIATDNGVPESIKQEFVAILYDEVMASFLRLARTLNLATRDAKEDGEDAAFTVPTNVSSTGDVATLVPIVVKDFLLFQNLVDFWALFLPRVQPSLFVRWVYLVSEGLVELSTQYPLVSGFYKMCGTCLGVCKTIGFFNGVRKWERVEEEAMETLEEQISPDATPSQRASYLLYIKYLREVYARLLQYKDDLLAACLSLVLSAPRELTHVPDLVSPIQIALRLGLSYHPLASITLDAMELWMVALSPGENRKWIGRVLPFLNDYLMVDVETILDSAEETMGIQMVTKKGKEKSGPRSSTEKMRNKRRKAMTATLLGVNREQAVGLRDLQVKILRLLGRLGGDNKLLLEEQASQSGHGAYGNDDEQSVPPAPRNLLAWDPEKRIRFKLPYSETKIEIIFDDFLPRITELAESSLDRKTKVAACELLHALVLIMIGNSAFRARSTKEPTKSPYHRLYLRTFPILLRLAVDVDQVARRLFRPLVNQLIHWLTNNAQYENPETVALLSTCVAAVCDTWGPLRDYGAECLAEFVKWSIKQTSVKQQETNPMNMKSLLKRLYTLASHPSAAKRLGASLTVNRIYRIFREEESLVDQFTFELLYWILLSLRLANGDHEALGTRQQAMTAVRHLQRIISGKSRLFLSETKARRKFPGLDRADLKYLVDWLFMETGRIETDYSQMCKQLFEDFVMLLPNNQNAKHWMTAKLTSSNEFLINLYETTKLDYVSIIGQSPVSAHVRLWTEQLICATDGYTWLISKHIVSPNVVLNQLGSNFVKAIIYFVDNRASEDVEGPNRLKMDPDLDTTVDNILTPMERMAIARKRITVTKRIFSFVKEVLSVSHDNPTVVQQLEKVGIFNPMFFRLFGMYLFSPAKMGIDQIESMREDAARKPEESFANLLEAFLKAFKRIASTDLQARMGRILAEVTFNSDADLAKIKKTSDFDPTYGISTASGMKILLSADFLPNLFGNDASMEPTNYLSLAVFLKALFDRFLELREVAEPLWIELVGNILELSLAEEESSQRLLSEILGIPGDANKQSYSMANAIYRKFGNYINNHFAQNFDAIMPTLMDNLRKPIVKDFIVGLLEYLLTNRKLKWQTECLINHFTSDPKFLTSLRSAYDNDTDRNLLLRIWKDLVNLDFNLLRTTQSTAFQHTFCDIYASLLSKDERDIPLSFKNEALDILPAFLSVEGPHLKKLEKGLMDLVAYQFPMLSKDLSKGTAQYNDYITALEKLIQTMVNATSVPIFQVLVRVVIREQDHVYGSRIQDGISKFATKLVQSKFDDVTETCFCYFSGNNLDITLRRNAVRLLLVPMLALVPNAYVLEFFKRHIVEAMELLQKPVLRRGTNQEVKQDLIERISCFNLIQVLYERLPADDLHGNKNILSTVWETAEERTNGKKTPTSQAGKKLTIDVTRIGHASKSQKVPVEDTDIAQIRMEFHRSAYNAIAAAIACTQLKEDFYRGFLFQENEARGEVLWENLIDIQVRYNFEVELAGPMVKFRLENFRTQPGTQFDTNIKSSPLRYLSSQYLADSSVSLSIAPFAKSPVIAEDPEVSEQNAPSVVDDDEETSPIDANDQTKPEITSSIDLELDTFNRNECMPVIIKVITKLHTIIKPLPDKSGMPAWMSELQKKFAARNTPLNVKLLLAKIVVNFPEAFEQYAIYWIRPIIELVVHGPDYGEPMNYFVQDLCVILIAWGKETKLDDSYEVRSMLLSLMTYLMKHAYHSNRRILRNNIEIVKGIFENWGNLISVPTKAIYDNINNPSKEGKENITGIQLMGVVLAHNKSPFNDGPDIPLEGLSERMFYQALIDNLLNKSKDVYASAAEVCGWSMKYMRNNDRITTDFEVMVVEKLSVMILTQGKQRDSDKFLTCLHKIQLYDSALCDQYMNQIMYLLPQVHGPFKVYALDIIASCADRVADLFRTLQAKDLLGLLRHREEMAQLATLRILYTLLKNLDESQVDYLLDTLIDTFRDHSNLGCRQLFYMILIGLYERFSESRILGEKLKIQLLRGLSDSADDIRNVLIEFWQGKKRLSLEIFERLQQLVINMYAPEVEDLFLNYATHILFEPTKKTFEYDKPIFDEPLPNAKFDQEYEKIDTSWQRSTAMTPLFVSTQDAGGREAFSKSFVDGGGLRATQTSLAFSLTQTEDTAGALAQFGGLSQTPSTMFFTTMSKDSSLMPSSETNLEASDSITTANKGRARYGKLQQRFLKSDIPSSTAYFAQAQERLKKRAEKYKSLQQRARANKVTMFRKYRIGELPDIQIKYKELIVPLQVLSQKDVEISRMSFTSLFVSVFKNVDENVKMTEDDALEYKRIITNQIHTILKRSQKYYSPFIGSFLRICHDIGDIQLDPSIIGRASVGSLNQQIGICVLERQVHCSVPQERASKRARFSETATASISKHIWIEIARLYKSIDESDIFRSIYQYKIALTKYTKDAIDAEVMGDYGMASRILSNAIQEHQEEAEETELLVWEQERQECFKKLGKWEDLSEHVLTDIDNNLERLWDQDWQDPYLRYFIQSHLKLIDGSEDPDGMFIAWDEHNPNPLFDFIDKSMENSERSFILESQYPIELALAFVIANNYDRSRYYIRRAYDQFVTTWSNMHPLARNSRLSKLTLLQQTVELDEFLSRVGDKNSIHSNIDQFIKPWENRYPSKEIDSIEIWDDIVSDRKLFFERISDISQGLNVPADVSLKVQEFEKHDIVAIASAARRQNNFDVAAKYLRKLSKLGGGETRDYYPALKLNYQRVLVAESDMQKVSILGRMLANIDKRKSDIDQLEPAQKVKINVLAGMTYEIAMAELRKGDHAYERFRTDQYIVKTLDEHTINNQSSLLQYFNDQGFWNFREAVQISAENKHLRRSQAKTLWRFAKYCDGTLRSLEANASETVLVDKLNYSTVVIESVFRAMSYGLMQALELFPRLLQLIELYPNTRTAFKNHVASFDATWMFLRWLPQIVAILDKEGASSVHPIIEKIANEYSRAIYYPLAISSEYYQFTADDKGMANKMAVGKFKQLTCSPLLEQFTLELRRLTNPEHILKDWIDNVGTLITDQVDRRQEIIAAFQDLNQLLLKPHNLGAIPKSFADKHAAKLVEMCGKDGSKLAKMNIKEFHKIADYYQKEIVTKKYDSAPELLKSYSPWLAAFQASNFGEEMEIPGQYTGISKPHPALHPKISSFDSRVLVMSSIRKPKRIMIMGSDENEYLFLVKGGEDLRLDQRVQQLFSIMNGVMKQNAYCAQQKIYLTTYKVVPMTGNVGIIEWLDNTKPLRSCIEGELNSKEYMNKGQELHRTWVAKFKGALQGYPNMFKASRDEAVRHFNQLAGFMRDDLLRSAVYKLAASPEAFLSIRSEFVNTLASICICGYLLGIGDRHLENFLIDLSRGRMITIDFGHAFGSATELLPVPELIPFRLTRQLVGFLEPLGVAGLLEHPMINIMQAMRTSKEILLNAMDIFVKEPLLDWRKHASKQAKAQKKDADQESFQVSASSQAASEWYPQQKLDIARRKLEGENPAFIFVQELAYGHNSKPYFHALEKVTYGESKYDVRAQVPRHCHTVKEQVDCLVNLATDPNCLARVWIGWMAWV